MIVTVAEFAPAQEIVTATLQQTLETGESYVGPIHVGCYTDSTEIWIECEGHRIGIEAENLKEFIKQLRRAAIIQTAQTKEPP